MPQIWKERYDRRKHHNKMWGTDGVGEGETRDERLVPRYVYFVRVCSFTFELHSVEQIEACLAFYSKKIQPSSRVNIGAADQWECQRWYERLPLYLREESKRPKVVKALEQALKEFAEAGEGERQMAKGRATIKKPRHSRS